MLFRYLTVDESGIFVIQSFIFLSCDNSGIFLKSRSLGRYHVTEHIF